MVDTLQYHLYLWQQWANGLVTSQLSHLTPLSFALIVLAGLVTSLTPCLLSLLPLTIAYIGASEDGERWYGLRQSLWFALGLALTLAGMGLGAAALGKIYGQIGVGLPVVVSAIAIVMGLNLLELLPLRFPSLGTTDWIRGDFPPALRALLAGLTFGLIASPCSTPVLASLLAWVAGRQDLWLGGGVLLAYTLGSVLPLVVVGTFTGALKQLLALRQWSGGINTVSGLLLIGFGVFSLLSRLMPIA